MADGVADQWHGRPSMRRSSDSRTTTRSGHGRDVSQRTSEVKPTVMAKARPQTSSSGEKG
ncbi:hypothetical protein Scep_012487 [Stephania cephalantha]|uniref:Uncharacterized protein n=1 Tax=Stephania cephalantha TaxID=152367 RepID=A0AAP0JF80_9MAGN